MLFCRAPSLKVLHLISCSNIHNEGFVEAINKLPLLEELKLFACESIRGRATYEAVGKACQNLKRFEVGKRITLPCDFSIGHGGNSDCDEARGIATMRGLRSLKIYLSTLNNKALAAILDNCRHLENLDLQFCFNISVDAAMRAEYAGIKMVVCPDFHNKLSWARSLGPIFDALMARSAGLRAPPSSDQDNSGGAY